MAEAQQAHLEATVAAARGGGDFPLALAVLDARRAEEEYQVRVAAIRDAEERVGSSLVSALVSQVDGIIVDHLRPAFGVVMEVASALAAEVAPYGADSESILKASVEAIRAWNDLGEMATRYAAIRNARTRLAAESGQVQHDAEGLFAELPNLPDLWPARMRHRAESAPWPMEPKARLVWLTTTPGVTPWLPTPAEQDRQALAYFGDGIERQQRGQVMGRAVMVGPA